MVVLAVGELAELDFYRAVTRGLGVREYLPKPLTRDKVALTSRPSSPARTARPPAFWAAT